MSCPLKCDNKLVLIGGAAVVIGAAIYFSKASAPKKTDAELVRENWSLVAKDLQGAGDLFYSTLFGMVPSLKTGVFGKSDMKVQALRLMQMVDGAVKLLDDSETLIPTLLKLGERHVYYGTLPEHYPVVGTALVATLKKALGEKLTADHEAAWGRIYGVISSTMIKGAEGKK